MLVLFDIDATLISTSRAGIDALEQAGRMLHGESFSSRGVEFAGRLDPLIIRDMLVANGLEPTPQRCAELRTAYRTQLPARLLDPARRCTCLPGVPELVTALETRSDVTIGLLTGNFEDTGSIKLRACGLEPLRFSVRVWGDDSPHDPPSRDHLPGVALERCARLRGAPVDARRALIIGDTPHDVRCAKAAGMRCLGVATGHHDVAALSVTGADRVVSDLSNTAEILSWIHA